MEDPSRILIATDGSKSADRAAYLGIKFARQYGAKVYAVYVKTVTAYDTVIIDEAWCTEALQEYDKEAHRATLSIVDKAKFAGLDAVPVILKGVVADEILNFADKHGVDLIVFGSHGRGGFERFALGSVSEKVVRHAKVPVLVVR